MMKKLRCMIAAVALLGTAVSAPAQSADIRIAEAMNSGDWFALDSIYHAESVDSISSFLEVFSRCLIGNRFNRPDVSIPAFECLLESHSSELGLHNLLNSSVMYSMDLSRVGENAKAAALLESVVDATRSYLDSVAVAQMDRYVEKYRALSEFSPYTVSFDGAVGRVPFRLVPVGKPEKGALLMHLDATSINGMEADATFDTGAGANIMSEAMAEKYGLIPLEASNTVVGIGRRDGRYAIAKELKLGNVMVTDVPFLVLDITTGHAEADMYVDSFSIVLGSELMAHLKDLTLDFVDRQILIPSVAPERTAARPNLSLSQEMNLLTKGSVMGDRMLINIDTGDASFGTLYYPFFERNREYVETHSELDSIRMAGIGGVYISQCYKVADVPVELGGGSVRPPQMAVLTDSAVTADYGCNLGVKTLMMFGRVRFNMVDFVLTVDSHVTGMVSEADGYILPEFKASMNSGSDFLQTLGIIAVGVARTMKNPNAPSVPDL